MNDFLTYFPDVSDTLCISYVKTGVIQCELVMSG